VLTVKLPSRLGLALGTLVTGLVGLSLEVSMSHPLHVASGLVGAFVLFMISPIEGTIATPAAALPVDGSNVKPQPPPV
jgi:hypothetical protein